MGKIKVTLEGEITETMRIFSFMEYHVKKQSKINYAKDGKSVWFTIEI